MRYSLPFALALAACNGSDTNIVEQHPEITVAPELVLFGDVPVHTAGEATVFVSNGGAVSLTADFSFADGADPAFGLATTHAEIGVDETLSLVVTLTPETYLAYSTALVIDSDDEENPQVLVPLSGMGVPSPAPDIEVEPLAIDFDTVSAGDDDTEYFTVKNVGNADLVIGTIEQAGSPAFEIRSDLSHQTITPNGSLPVIVQYAPDTDAGDHGTLSIPSNDPDESAIVVQMLGNGGGDAVYPVAVIDCPDQSAPPEWVGLDGDGSYDPQALEPLTYAWELASRPDGSQGEIDDLDALRPSLYTDVAGTYDVELRVTNTSGIRSAPARCTVQAVPDDDIHVELSWDGASSDLDLHLRQADQDFFARPGDCNWCNPNTSWDAHLDLDDTTGLGPENINVGSPEDGTYLVAVHYFEADGDGPVNATVRVYTYGVLVDTAQLEIERNEVWTVGQINWPAGTFGRIDDVDIADERDCY